VKWLRFIVPAWLPQGTALLVVQQAVSGAGGNPCGNVASVLVVILIVPDAVDAGPCPDVHADAFCGTPPVLKAVVFDFHLLDRQARQ